MPRALRIEYPNAFYHVMNRGKGRGNIFHDKKHYQLFLEILAQANQKFGVVIHAYCLMNTHYHLLLETPFGNLSLVMRYINSVYTQKYNKLCNMDGPLFRGRFRAILIDEDSYLTALNRYIHRDPLNAKHGRLENYKWSSYPAYLGAVQKPLWLNKEKTLHILGIKNNHKKYKSFIVDANWQPIDDIYKKTKLPIILGDGDFKNKISKKNLENQVQVNKIIETHNRIEAVIEAVAAIFKVKKSVIIHCQKAGNKNNHPRKLAIYLCQKYCDKTLLELKKFFNLKNVSSVSKSLFIARQKIKNGEYDKELKMIKKLMVEENDMSI